MAYQDYTDKHGKPNVNHCIDCFNYILENPSDPSYPLVMRQIKKLSKQFEEGNDPMEWWRNYSMFISLLEGEDTIPEPKSLKN